MAVRRRSRPRSSEPRWALWSDDEILDLRLCDLRVRLEGTWVEDLLHRLHGELAARGIRLRPHAWLSNEWFSPDGVPGIAVPFYLAHPRLMQIERRQMLQVEGGTRKWCMRILRHEAGHAFDTAHRLRRTRRWKELFGRSSRTYPQTYRPRVESRNHVLHLDWWYAQSHPCEDFAETFAVWLTPGSRWRAHYRGWPVMRKLEYVAAVAQDLGPRPAAVRSRAHVDPVRGMRRTLRAHYRLRRERYGVDLPDFYDQQLERVFAPGRAASSETAAAFLRRSARELRRQVTHLTGMHPYTVDQLLETMIARARTMRLRRSRGERQTRLEAAVLLAAQVLGHVDGGGRRVVL